jgi:hypothetical protein
MTPARSRFEPARRVENLGEGPEQAAPETSEKKL